MYEHGSASAADRVRETFDEQLKIQGSCCCSVAEDVREMARALGQLAAESRIWKKGGAKPMSAYEYYDHDQMTTK